MLNLRYLLVGGLLAAVTSVSAQDDAYSCDEPIVHITNASDINFYKTCPKLDFMFFIDHTYSGPFEMSGVESVGQFSAGYLGPKLSGSDSVDDGVTSVSMPDLVNTTSGGMLLAYINNLTSISFPKLNSITGDLMIVDDDQVKTLTFPALSNITGGVLLDGDFDEISLPSLKTVGYIIVKSTGELNCPALGANLSSVVFTPGKYDSGVGLTCWTPDENNRYNSSETKTTGSSSASATGASATKTSASTTGTSTGAAATGTNSAGLNTPQFALALLAAGFVGQYLL